jgi:hypothetical protein
MNTNFGRINCSGNKNVFHAMKYELKKELVGAVKHTSFTTVYNMEKIYCLWTQNVT